MPSNGKKLWAVVPAAGIGSRTGVDTPKQYREVNGKKIIEHILERLSMHPRIAGIVVAISSGDRHWDTITLPDNAAVIAVEGGAERHHSVLNALHRLSQMIAANDWVLVHDAARPCVRQDDIDKLINSVIDHPVGGILGVPVSDTMKRVDENNQIVETVSRAGLWHAQTPQMFRLAALTAAIEHAIQTCAPITDEAGAVELQGLTPLMVEGHRDNIKITEPDDFMRAALYLQQQTSQVDV
jgi:2-C-methyl-D-erythritol 4-phosphate cytidylyltransferase